MQTDNSYDDDDDGDDCDNHDGDDGSVVLTGAALLENIMMLLQSLPLQMAERLLRAQPVSVANHVKARQSLIEQSELPEILLIYVFRIFLYYM